ncbi:MAG: zinc metalloprotease HtpX [Candidatus Hadarchaeota archaeon]
MSSVKHRLSMFGSVAAIISVVTLALYLFLSYFTSLSFFLVFAIIIPFFLLQWWFAPKIIEKAHGVKPASEDEYGRLHEVVERISESSGIEKPQLMIADTDLPNAFAYGNGWSGKKIALTKGLLKSLEFEEVEAVIGHEMGHHKNGDAKMMMTLSILPAIFMMIGRMFLFSMLFGRNRRGGAPVVAMAAGSMLVYFVLNLCIMNFSRMREFMADDHAAKIVPDGARKLSKGLAKINYHAAKMKEEKKSSKRGGRASRTKPSHFRNRGSKGDRSLGMSLKPLFISDPDTAKELDSERISDRELVEKFKKKELSTWEKVLELFSSHPNVADRLKALEQYY